MHKIVIIGTESTGKTTLCNQLSAYYNGIIVPEYARTYLNKLNKPYTQTDVLNIAKEQIKLELAALKQLNNFIFFDTDLMVIKIWLLNAYKCCPTWIDAHLQQYNYHLYLLTNIDLAWEYDPLREHSEPEQRAFLFNWYKTMLTQLKRNFIIISGSGELRFQNAVYHINKTIKN